MARIEKLKMIVLVTNDIMQDQRMHKVCTSLSMKLDITLIGRRINEHWKFDDRSYKCKLLDLPFPNGPLFYLTYNWKALIWLLRLKPDIVYCCDPDTLPAGIVFSLIFWRKKLVYDSHEYFIHVPELIHAPFKRRIWKYIERIGSARANLRLTVAESLAKLLYQEYGSKFYTIKNVPEKNTSNIQKAEFNKILLYQGVLNEGRGLELIIRSMKSLPKWKLWIIGRGDLEIALRKLTAQMEIESQVKFIGFKPPNQLVEYTSRAGIGLNLLERKSKSYEYSLANKTFDYMIAGLPAIHMNFPEYKQINHSHDCFYILESLTESRFLELVHSINRKNWTIKHQNNIRASGLFHWKIESDRLMELFDMYVLNN